ncbi:hypothetical protein [Flavobacterium sp. NKUCC04_CG]|uniref:hypothetical protein n=1 Tax=Flavobacterium sp. NKUCC04_CG TaxID=2842121 RepID=UPI001C5ABAE2|nr:hypothetical protein [Flavobacterium sp. NKUCC04_CG]MBW3520002.1 hypothetical protein [Flavobacterium sp. NKUCC04_CG]
MRTKFLLIVLLVYSVAQAQRISIKKGQVLLDKKAVVLLTTKKNIYTISSLEGQEVFSAEAKFLELENGVYKTWFVITDLETQQQNQVPHILSVMAVSRERRMIEELVKGSSKLITENGVDKNLLQSITQGEAVDLQAMFKVVNDSIVREFQYGDQVLADYKIRITVNGEILRPIVVDRNSPYNQQQEEFLGTIRFEKVGAQNKKLYTIADSENRVVARWSDFGITHVSGVGEQHLTNEVLMTNGQKYKVKEIPEESFKEITMDKSKMARRLLALVFAKGVLE